MEKWLEQIRYSLYDTLGLFIPGGLFLMMIRYIFDLDALDYLTKIDTGDKIKMIWNLSQISISLYLTGNILKITSQIFYDFFTSIFDEIVFKTYNCDEKGNIIKCFFCFSRSCFKELEFISFIKFLRKYLKNIFCFKADKYFSVNKFMIDEIIGKINKEKQSKLEKNWDSIYKIGKMYEDNKFIKSLSSVFLAKYTLYRSLSFIFFINFFLILFNDNYLIEITYKKIPNFLLIIIAFLSWLAFHIKYKRYYVYCGNETLVALYYKLILETEEK